MITSPRPCPPRSTPTHPSSLYTCGCIDKSIHQSLLLCLSLTQTSVLTHKGASVHSSLVSVFCIMYFASVCLSVHLSPSASIRAQPCLLFVFPRRCAPLLHYHGNRKLSPFITALINATCTCERARASVAQHVCLGTQTHTLPWLLAHTHTQITLDKRVIHRLYSCLAVLNIELLLQRVRRSA